MDITAIWWVLVYDTTALAKKVFFGFWTAMVRTLVLVNQKMTGSRVRMWRFLPLSRGKYAYYLQEFLSIGGTTGIRSDVTALMQVSLILQRTKLKSL